jgi:hypothetical protein
LVDGNNPVTLNKGSQNRLSVFVLDTAHPSVIAVLTNYRGPPVDVRGCYCPLFLSGLEPHYLIAGEQSVHPLGKYVFG